MTTKPHPTDALREALERIQYKAVSLADAQVIALEALAASKPEPQGVFAQMGLPKGPVLHKPSGISFDSVIAVVDGKDLMQLTPEHHESCGIRDPWVGVCDCTCSADPQAQAGEPIAWPDAPETIYLQVCSEDDGECSTPFREHTEVTWCEDKINDRDIRYIRADTIAKKDAALRACVEALKTCETRREIQGWDQVDAQQFSGKLVDPAITQAKEALK